MGLVPTVTFRGIRRSAALEREIAARLRRLETCSPRIMGCRVVVELRQRHHATGNRVHVRLDLTIPGADIVVAHAASQRATARHLEAGTITRLAEPDPERVRANVAVREAFEIARRRLRDRQRRRRGTRKSTARFTRAGLALMPIGEHAESGGTRLAAENGRGA